MAYNSQQTEILLDIAKQTNLYIPVLFAALCGLRRGEVCGLRWEDVNLEKKAATIRHSLNRISGKLTLGPVKTEESEAAVPLPDILIEQLKIEQKTQKVNRLKLGPAYQDGDYVWAWEDGRPHDPDYLYHAFQKMIKKYNTSLKADENLTEKEISEKSLPVIRFHDLRHTHATLLLAAKVDVKIVSKQLRHSKASFTADVYQHVLDDMQRETANVMNDMFGKSRLEEKEKRLEKGLEKTTKPAR